MFWPNPLLTRRNNRCLAFLDQPNIPRAQWSIFTSIVWPKCDTVAKFVASCRCGQMVVWPFDAWRILWPFVVWPFGIVAKWHTPILFTDANDALINGDVDDIVKKFKRTNFRIFFSAEHHCYPNLLLCPKYTVKKTFGFRGFKHFGNQEHTSKTKTCI